MHSMQLQIFNVEKYFLILCFVKILVEYSWTSQNLELPKQEEYSRGDFLLSSICTCGTEAKEDLEWRGEGGGAAYIHKFCSRKDF